MAPGQASNHMTNVVSVITADGLHGVISQDIDIVKDVTLTLDDGRQVVIQSEILTLQTDGGYHLPVRIGPQSRDAQVSTSPNEQIVIPIIQETIHVDKQMRETGRVQIDKVVHEVEHVINEPLLREQVQVEHVLINKVIVQPAESRYEGETLILPIMEEVLVIEKRLMLKEEVRITVHKTTVSEPRQVIVRQEEVNVQRVPADDTNSAESTT